MKSPTVKRPHPIVEAVANKLSGIESAPKSAQTLIVREAMSTLAKLARQQQDRIDELENWCMVYDICLTCGDAVGCCDCGDVEAGK